MPGIRIWVANVCRYCLRTPALAHRQSSPDMQYSWQSEVTSQEGSWAWVWCCPDYQEKERGPVCTQSHCPVSPDCPETHFRKIFSIHPRVYSVELIRKNQINFISRLDSKVYLPWTFHENTIDPQLCFLNVMTVSWSWEVYRLWSRCQWW